jgi:NO-binding membrane sensor protein with MHYT domain
MDWLISWEVSSVVVSIGIASALAFLALEDFTIQFESRRVRISQAQTQKRKQHHSKTEQHNGIIAR